MPPPRAAWHRTQPVVQAPPHGQRFPRRPPEPHTLLPGENISVDSVENSVVLNGAVSTAGRSEKARALAAAVAAGVKGSNVVNQLAVDTPNQVNLRVRIAQTIS